MVYNYTQKPMPISGHGQKHEEDEHQWQEIDAMMVVLEEIL